MLCKTFSFAPLTFFFFFVLKFQQSERLAAGTGIDRTLTCNSILRHSAALQHLHIFSYSFSNKYYGFLKSNIINKSKVTRSLNQPRSILMGHRNPL